ncbi:MAG: hypothetical protein ACUVUD_02090 [bacterium]
MLENGSPEGPGRLEFKPDESRLAKLARFRRFVLLLTIFLLSGALLLLILIQPRWMMSEVGVKPEASNAEVAGSNGEMPASPSVFQPARISDDERIKGMVISSAGKVDSSAKIAVAMWERAEMLVLEGLLERDGAEEVLNRIVMAKVINDSARNLLRQVKAELTHLQSLRSSTGNVVRLRAFLAAGSDYMAMLEEEAVDRQAWLEAYETAIRSFASGDKAEYEIKGNVAGGYLRKCEVRRRKLMRAGVRLTETYESLKQRF